MKKNIWAKTILTSYRYFDRIANALDKMIELKGLNSANVSGSNYSTNNIFTLAEKLIDLGERKVKIINLKVLCEKCLELCDEKSAVILVEKYIENRKNDDLAQRNGLTYRTFFRKLKLAEDKFEIICAELGFDFEKLDEYLKNEHWIMKIKSKFEDCQSQESVKFEAPVLDRLAVS